VSYLSDAPADLRADFAGTALRLLASAYAEEATLAREEAREAENPGRLLGWSSAVEQFTGQLQLVLEDIVGGFPVQLGANAGDSLVVTVAQRTVILNHPRVGGQESFEQAVLSEFCSRHPCERYTPGADAREPIPVSAGRIRPAWAFTETGPVCSHRGIHVHWSGAADIGRARATCRQFIHEVVTLADEIAWQRRHAVPVDWSGLRLSANPGRPEHRLALNGAGDVVLTAVPVIYGSPGLLQQLVPWLRARADGRQEASIKVQAADFGWESGPG